MKVYYLSTHEYFDALQIYDDSNIPIKVLKGNLTGTEVIYVQNSKYLKVEFISNYSIGEFAGNSFKFGFKLSFSLCMLNCIALHFISLNVH